MTLPDALADAAARVLAGERCTVGALDHPTDPSGYVILKGRPRIPCKYKDQRGWHLAWPVLYLVDARREFPAPKADAAKPFAGPSEGSDWFPA